MTPPRARKPASDALPLLEAALPDHPSVCAAVAAVAAEADVSEAALLKAWQRAGGGAGPPHGNHLLTSDQDEALLAVVQAFSINIFALSSMQIAEVGHRRWGVAVSLRWVRKWVDSHRKWLGWRACKALADKRAGAQVIKDVQGFCELLSILHDGHSFHSDAVFNYDETRVVLRGGRLTTQRVEARGKDRPNATFTRNNTVASLLTFIAANGTVFFSVYVLKGQFNEGESADVSFTLEKAPPASRREWPRLFCWTETGYLSADTFGKVMDLFTGEWGVRNPGRKALLFGDQLGSHKNVKTIEAALLKGVFLSFPRRQLVTHQPAARRGAICILQEVGGGARGAGDI